MRILHVVPSFGLGGMERIICTFVNHSSEVYNHTIISLTAETRARKWLTPGRAKLTVFNKGKTRNEFFRTLYNRLRADRPTLLLTYNWGATDAIWLGRFARIPHLIHCEHGFNFDEGEKTLWKRDVVRLLAYRFASKVIVVSQDLRLRLRRKYFLRTERVVQIPNGIDTSYYAPDFSVRQQMRKELGFKETEIVVGFSGRLDPIKNLSLLADIFAKSVRTGVQFRFLIVGDGPEQVAFENLLRGENILSSVVFVGSQEDVLPYLRAMDVFVLTSLREQMPLTILEAMAVGIPVVATNVGEIPRIVDDGVSGFVHDKQEPAEHFVRSLLMLASPTQRKMMEEAARKKIIEHFQQGTMVQRYEAVIRDVRGEISASI